MAVMYSKLGGCLGVTSKLGPLARTDLWAGVKGLLERLMTHCRVKFFIRRTLGWPTGGWRVGLSSQEMVLFSWEDWGALCLGWMPMALPDWPCWIARLTCMGRACGLGNTASFAGRKESSGLGRAAAFTRGKVSSCQERIASFARRKVSNCWRDRRNACCLTVCLGNAASFAGGKESSGLGGLGRAATYAWGKVSNCQRRVRRDAWCLTAYWGGITGLGSNCLLP